MKNSWGWDLPEIKFELYPGQSQNEAIKDLAKEVSTNTAVNKVAGEYQQLYNTLEDSYKASLDELTAGNRGATRRGLANITAMGSRVAPGGVMTALQRGYEEESDAKLRQALLGLEKAKADNLTRLKMAEITGKAQAEQNVQNQWAQQEQKDAQMLGSVLGLVGTIGGAMIGGVPGALAGSQLGNLTGIPELDIPADFDPDTELFQDF